MTPAEKVAHGLDLAAEGMAELRAERVMLADRLAENRAAFVHGEGRAVAMRFSALRGRDARAPSQVSPPRLHDGQRTAAQLSAETARSLDLYVPTASAKAAPPKLRRGLLARLFSLAVFAFLLAGCASPLDAARVSLGAVVATYQAAEPRLEAERAAAGQACLDAAPPPEPCLSAVRAKWAPVRKASERAYRAIVAALAMLHLTEAGVALGQAPDVTRLARAVSLAVDAASAFQAAIEVP